MKLSILISVIVLAGGFIFWKDIQGLVSSDNNTEKHQHKKKNKKAKDEPSTVSSGIEIKERWDLPAILKEISGIAYLDENRFACVQDEEGSIFIYNIASKQIEKKIHFAGTGDYEGITVNGQTAYVVRADGKLFEVNLNGKEDNAREYSTSLTVEQNVEGLCFDAGNNRLLLAIKNDEPGNVNYKGIYTFDLSRKEFKKEPVYKIDLTNEMVKGFGGKKNKSVMPSAIGIHPATKEIYITDGPKSELLILDKSGNMKKLLQLGKEFAQPEGLTFNPQGEMFISNEGTKQPGNILKVGLP